MTLQRFVLRGLPLIVFLLAYFVLTVLGNLVYRLPSGEIIGQVAVENFSLKSFPAADTPGFFILLFMPFVVTPIVAIATKRAASGLVSSIAALFREFRPLDYAVISALLYGYVISALTKADALGLIRHGDDMFAAVRSRYELLDRLGYWPQMCLKSLLLFLACYAFAMALRGAGRFWIIATAVTFVLMTTLLVLLNMKWPILIYYVALTMAAFCLSPRRPFIYGITCMVLTIGSYAMISSVLLRLAPSTQATSVHQKQKSSAAAGEALSSIGRSFSFLGDAASAAISNSALLGFTLLNRMAQPYPYYFETFHDGRHPCGTLVDRIERKTNPCQPSNMVYDEMFGDSQFGTVVAGRGTAPQAAHIYGFALQGWIGAIVELVLASIVIGLFMAVPVSNAITGTIVVMGGTVGYFFSQLPFEGPIIYDHGLLWWSLLIAAYATFRAAIGQLEASHA